MVERSGAIAGDFVFVPNVRAICDGLSLICTLDGGAPFIVPWDCIGELSEVRREGDHGVLVVLRSFAEESGLLRTR